MKPLVARDPYRIGLVAIAVGVGVALLVVSLSVMSFGSRSYTAVLEHTAGLRPGEDVQVAGISVGQVKAVDLVDDEVRVTFVVDDDVTLGSRTTAAVRVATLLGNHYLAVDPQGTGRLAGDTIPRERTSVPYNLQDVLERGTSTLEKLDPVLLAEALNEMSDTLRASNENLEPALLGVARLSDVISQRTDQAGDLLESARSVTEQLSDSSQDIIGLMRQTNLVVSEITARREAIHRLLVETTRLSRSLTAIVEGTRDDLRPALRNLNRSLDTLRAQDKSLRHVLETMAPAVRYVANATGNGPWLDLYLQGPVVPADDATCKLGDC
ncbi:MCE family protein [Nocardioides sp.]|uniref:MCE family protein n=1 Tax=Nocardioides sp. TaxID=35761 RepID=UPI0027323826|nr:MCE family protein [Nocardioides sp.]MDP3892729.1 MCE family protein [Nocardioides sp.]